LAALVWSNATVFAQQNEKTTFTRHFVAAESSESVGVLDESIVTDLNGDGKNDLIVNDIAYGPAGIGKGINPPLNGFVTKHELSVLDEARKNRNFVDCTIFSL